MTFMWLCPYYLWFLIRSRSVFFLVQIIIIINTIIGRMQNMYSLNVIGDSVREMQSCFYTFNVKNSLNVCDDVTQYITCTQCNCWFMWLNGKHCRNHIWMRTHFFAAMNPPVLFIFPFFISNIWVLKWKNAFHLLCFDLSTEKAIKIESSKNRYNSALDSARQIECTGIIPFRYSVTNKSSTD